MANDESSRNERSQVLLLSLDLHFPIDGRTLLGPKRFSSTPHMLRSTCKKDPILKQQFHVVQINSPWMANYFLKIAFLQLNPQSVFHSIQGWILCKTNETVLLSFPSTCFSIYRQSVIWQFAIIIWPIIVAVQHNKRMFIKFKVLPYKRLVKTAPFLMFCWLTKSDFLQQSCGCLENQY